MTLGNRIKQLRIQKGVSQEKLAEELHVSRSAIAKWETDGGIPDLNNLVQIAETFGVSLDELIRTAEKKEKRTEDMHKTSSHTYGNQYYDIELTGWWNDGVYHVLIVGEDTDFLFYEKADKKKTVYGIIGKKYITSILPIGGKESEHDLVMKVGREFFCGKSVAIELAKKEGLIRGFFDFRDDAYCNVVIDDFGKEKVYLSFGGDIQVDEITKIEEIVE